jgi:hypothetical protein
LTELLHNNKRKQKSNNDAIIDKKKGNITLRIVGSSPSKRTINYRKMRNLLIVVKTAERRSGLAISPVVVVVVVVVVVEVEESCYCK